VYLEDVLGEIQTDRANLHVDGPLIVIRLRRSPFGTSMPGAGGRGRDEDCSPPPAQIPAALLTHRAPTLDGDEEPFLWPRMQDAWERQIPVGDRLHPSPRQPTALAAAHEGAVPAVDHVMSEC
jgi:hypothetical protein